MKKLILKFSNRQLPGYLTALLVLASSCGAPTHYTGASKGPPRPAVDTQTDDALPGSGSSADEYENPGDDSSHGSGSGGGGIVWQPTPTPSPNPTPAPTPTPLPAPVVDSFPYSQTQLLNENPDLVGIDYDYEYAMQRIASTEVEVAVDISNSGLLARFANLGVVLVGSSLNDTGEDLFFETRIDFLDDDSLVATAGGFEPATVYKLYLHLFEVTSETSALHLGAYEYPYYFVTGDDTDSLAEVRASFVMKGLAEFYDWELGRYDSSKGYTDDPGYGWCHMFYNWVIKEHLNTTYSHSFYNSSAWKDYPGTYHANTSDMIDLDAVSAIHGDFMRDGGHALMLLAYDSHLDKVWTLEGNFNNRVVIWKRSPGSGDWMGHVSEDMVRPGVLP